MTPSLRYTFPALRCHMGDWVYYVTNMRFGDIVNWIKRKDEIHQNKKLSDMIQRELSGRVQPIADYLIEQPERFFNAIVVGVYGGDPQWYPIEVRESPVLGEANIDDEARDSIGLLWFEGNENLFAIDGQHRVEAIKQAVRAEASLAGEIQSMIFVAHRTDSNGLRRTRRLFSTLNRYAKPVSLGEIVALDEDDGFAIITRKLVEEFDLIKEFVHFGRTKPIPPNDYQNLTSVLALYEITELIATSGIEKGSSRRFKLRRPDDSLIESVYEIQTRYWKLLGHYVPEYKELFASKPGDAIASKYRTKNGGHFLFRPLGQQVFARAIRTMVKNEDSLEEAIVTLSSIPMDIAAEPWINIIWDPGTAKLRSTVSKVFLENLLLYMVNKPYNKKYDLLTKYRDILNDGSAELPKA